MRLLRDLKESTTLLILLEITTGRHTKLKTIAEKLGITIQGVSEYLKGMTKAGLVVNIRGEYKATNKGIELLHQNFLEIKDFVDESMKKLAIIDVCTAIAGNDIMKGDSVGLFMEKGILTAYANKKSNSMGTAASSGKKGDDVGIRNLEGVVALKPGQLWIVKIPDTLTRGSRKVISEKAKKIYRKMKTDRIAALDLVAFSLIKKLNLKCHIEFAATESSLEALQKGLSVTVFGSEDEVNRFVTRVNEFNVDAAEKIKYQLISL